MLYLLYSSYTHIATYIFTVAEFCSFIVQQRKENGSLEAMNVSTSNCYYTGSVANHHFSRVSFSMCGGEMVRTISYSYSKTFEIIIYL